MPSDVLITPASSKIEFTDGGNATKTLKITGTSLNTDTSFAIGATTANNTLSVLGSASIGSSYNVAGPTNGLIVQGNVGIGTTSPSSILDVVGILRFDSLGASETRNVVNAAGQRIFAPGGGAKFLGNSSTGAIRIKSPINGSTDSFITIKGTIFEYAAGKSFDFLISGYYYTNSFANVTAQIIGGPYGVINRNFTIRIGRDTNNALLFYIGELADTWAYGYIYLTEVFLGWSISQGTLNSYQTGWSITNEASAFENVMATATDTQITNWSRSGTSTYYNLGNVGVGGTPSYKLDVNNGSSQFALRLLGSNADGPVIRFENTGASGRIYHVGSTLAASGAGAGFSIYDVTGSASRVLINSNGNVGIGTINPASLLHVGGTSTPTATATPTAIQLDNSFRNAVGGNTSLKFYLYKNSNESYGFGLNNAGGIEYHAGYSGGGTSNHAFYTDTTEKVRINNAGNVGIGTTAPLAKLHVAGTTGLYQSANSTYLYYDHTGVNTWRTGIFTDNTSSYIIGHDTGGTFATKILTIAMGGNVGIGTTTPNAKLESYFSSNALTFNYLATNINVNSPIPTYAFGVTSPAETVSIKAGIGYERHLTNGRGAIHFYNDSANDTSNISGSRSSIGDIKMTIQNDGNVGIGSTIPTAKLDIVGTNSTLALSFGNTVPNNPLFINTYGGFSGVGMDSATAGIRLAGDYGGGTNPLVDIGYYTSGSVSHANWISRLKIINNGNVGIGTTNPATKLDVYGPVSIRGTTVLTTNFDIAGSGPSDIYANIRVLRGASLSDGMYIGYGGAGGPLRFFSNSGTTEFVTIATTGNVGIGATNPSFKLDVSGTVRSNIDNAFGFVLNRSATNTWSGIGYTTASASKWFVGLREVGDDNLRWYNYTNSAERMVLTEAGNLGLGTTAPSLSSGKGLHIFSNSGHTNLKLDNAGRIWELLATTSGYFSVYDTTGGADRLSIASSGNVGIGNTSPNNKLHVNGSTSIGSGYNTAGPTNGLIVQGNVGVGTTNPSAKLSTGASSGMKLLVYDNPSTGVYTGLGQDLAAGNSTDLFAHSVSNLGFLTFGKIATNGSTYTEWARFNTSGNLGVGTTNPLAQLHINEVISGAAALRIDGTNGTLFSVIDDLSDSLMSVNNSAGLPVLEVFADDRIIAGQYGANDLVIRNNRVGIGTSNPTNELHVYASAAGSTVASNAIAVFEQSSNAGIQVCVPDASEAGLFFSRSGAAYYSAITRNGTDLLLKNNSATAVTINSSGNVGINTANPTTKLYVTGSITALDGTFISNVTSGADKYFLNCYGTSTNQMFSLYENSSNVYLNSYTTMALRANQNGGSGGYITLTGGNVGIGTTSPSSTLHLYGAAPTILTLGSTSYPSTYLTTLGVDSSARGFLIFGNNGENQVRAGRTAAGGYLDFYTNNTVAQTTATSDGNFVMRLASNGNVGINTTTPAYRLDVNGTFNASGTATLAAVSISGTITSSTTEAIRINNNNGYISIYNTAGSTRTGYIQGNTGNSLTLAAENSAILQFNVGGSERARIGTSGNVGIGTTNTGYSLNLYAASAPQFALSNATRSFVLTNNAGDGLLSFYYGTANRLQFDTTNQWFNTGNLGIGTTTTSATLQVGANSTAVSADNSPIARFGGSGSGSRVYGLTLANTASAAISNDSSLSFIVAGNYSATGIISAVLRNTSTAATDLVFTNYNSSLQERMRIQFDGNVGIGTSLPAALLQIGGLTPTSATGGIQFGDDTSARLYRSASGIITCSGTIAATFSGNLTGNVTGNVSGTAGGETLGTVTGRGASTGTQISVSSSAGGSMFTGTKSGAGYSDGVSGATFKSITDNPNAGSYAFAAYFNGSSGTNSFFVGADGVGYFRSNVGVGTSSFAYSASNRGLIEIYGSTDAILALRNSSGNFYIQRSGSDFYLNNASGFLSISTGGAERVRVQANGNVGIGTTIAAVQLQVGSGSPTGATAGIQFGDDTGARIYRSASSEIKLSGGFQASTYVIAGNYLQTLNNLIYPAGFTSTQRFEVGNAANNAWIDGITLAPGGNVVVAGTLTESSSIRYKENIETISAPILPKLNQIRPVTYNKKDNPKHIEYGIIAEELNELFPEFVNKNENGEVESVNYSRLTVILIKAVKELQEEVEKLKNK